MSLRIENGCVNLQVYSLPLTIRSPIIPSSSPAILLCPTSPIVFPKPDNHSLHCFLLFTTACLESVLSRRATEAISYQILFKTFQGLIEFPIAVRTRILCMASQGATRGGPCFTSWLFPVVDLYLPQHLCSFSLEPLHIFSLYILLSSSCVIYFPPRAFLNFRILLGLPWLFLFSPSHSPLCFPTTLSLFYSAFLTYLCIHLADSFQPF